MEYYLSRDLVHAALERNELDNLRLYLFLRARCADFSGHFEIKALPSMMKELGYRSLDDIPANRSNIRRFTEEKSRSFMASRFFIFLKDGLLQVKSEKKVLIEYKGNAVSTKYLVPAECMASRRLFMDFCIGVYLSNTRCSNKKAAETFGVTVRRIQLATSRNHGRGTVIKTHRKVLEFFGTREGAFRRQQELEFHKIHAGQPFRINSKGDWAVPVNTTNTYRAAVMRRTKGKIRRITLVKQRAVMSEQWFKPAFRGRGGRAIRQWMEEKTNSRLLVFNERVYTMNAFIADHSYFCR